MARKFKNQFLSAYYCRNLDFRRENSKHIEIIYGAKIQNTLKIPNFLFEHKELFENCTFAPKNRLLPQCVISSIVAKLQHLFFWFVGKLTYESLSHTRIHTYSHLLFTRPISSKIHSYVHGKKDHFIMRYIPKLIEVNLIPFLLFCKVFSFSKCEWPFNGSLAL